MRKIRKFLSALMAGMTLFAMVPVNAETYNGKAIEDEVAQAESPEASNSTKISGEGLLDNTLSWLRDLFLPRVFAASQITYTGTWWEYIMEQLSTGKMYTLGITYSGMELITVNLSSGQKVTGYCIDPNAYLAMNGYSEVPLSEYNYLDAATLDRLDLVTRFGYGYGEHNDNEWYLATQSLVYDAILGGADVVWTNMRTGEESRFLDKLDEINALIEDCKSPPTIELFREDGSKVEKGDKLSASEVIKVTGKEKSIEKYRISSIEGAMLCDSAGNTITNPSEYIRNDSFYFRVLPSSAVSISLDYGEKPAFSNVKFVMVKPGSQNIITCGVPNISRALNINLEVNKETLKLQKKVNSNIEDFNSFKFSVFFYNLEPETTYAYGEQEFTSDKEGNANVNVHLKNGEEAVFENIPTGTRYRILEEAGDYISSYTITDANNLGMINQTTDANENKNEELATATETIDAGEDVTVTFTNNITKTQNLSISKVVKDAEGQLLEDGTRYEFTAEFSNTEPGTEIKSDLGILRTDDNGQVTATFYLANGETVKVTDIPVGTQYRFTEAENSATASYKITDTLENQSTVTTEAANDKPKLSLSTATETVDNGEDTNITFTNTISNGSLTITKKNTNGEPLMGAEFSLTDSEGTIYTPTQTATDFEGKISWTELPFGTYTLTETKAPAGASLMKESMVIEITSETPDIEISITDNSVVYLDAGGTGLITWMTVSSAVLALTVAYLLTEKRKKKSYGV